MDKDALIRRLMKTFLDELGEHVQALNQNLLALERTSDTAARMELIRTLFRTAHSLKGAARSVNVEMLETAGHRLESIFADARDGVVDLEPALFELLFATADGIGDFGRRLRAEEDTAASPLAGILSNLDDACSDRSQAPTILPAETDSAVGEADASPTSASRDPTDGTSAAPMLEGSVRISAARLDRMLALGGELLVARRRAETRVADIDRLRNIAMEWESDLRAAERGKRRATPRNGDAATAQAASGTHERTGTTALVRDNFRRLNRQIDHLESRLFSDRRGLEQVAAPLEAEVMRARMIPFATACEGFERIVRDLARTAGKDVELILQGGEIEVDRLVIEGVKDALLHLVRNAIDHGIESATERTAAGKPGRGRISMAAGVRNGRVEIVVDDDGGGFRVEAIREQARRRNLHIPETDRDIARLIFTPGFSTSPMITTLSGRGVGLDVVKTAVESLRGDVDVSSKPGAGTRFTLTVPLSLTMLPALIVNAGGQTFAFDSAAVGGLRRVAADELHMIEGRDVLTDEKGSMPVVVLTDILGQTTQDMPGNGGKAPIVVLVAGTDRAAFVVNELVAEQEVVVKDLGARLRRVRNVIGATVLSTGRIALILNAAELVRAALGHASRRSLTETLAAEPIKAKRRLLVVEDSVTTRTLMKSILEAAGYEVMVAADGSEAWQILQETGADLVVSDIEMPRMDGFALTEAVRGSKRFRDVPVILVTALASEDDKIRGMEAGADAYLVKSGFDQTTLIETISQIL